MSTSNKRGQVSPEHLAYWRNCQRQYAAQKHVWEDTAWRQARKAASLLRERFGVNRVIVFGSLVRDRFGEGSDIDMAVGGLEKADFFPALAAVNEGCNRWIDLKPLEDLDPHFKRRVLETGRELDEAP